MVGALRDPLLRRIAAWGCMLALWINGVAAAQGPTFPSAGAAPAGARTVRRCVLWPGDVWRGIQRPRFIQPSVVRHGVGRRRRRYGTVPYHGAPTEFAPPNVPPPAGAPGNPAAYRPPTPVNVGPASAPAPRPGVTPVADVVFEGLRLTRRGQLPKLGTRPNEPYDPQIVEEDVKRLMKSRKFIDVAPKIQSLPQGVRVIFQVVERPIIQYIKMVGNQGVLTSTLIGKTDLKVGDGMDPYSVKEGRDKLEAYYQEHGWDRARVAIVEGNKPGDRGAIFLIDEGRAQKVWWTKFVGNTIVSAARLRTQIATKPPILWIFKGYVNRKKIDEDVQKLTAYYRGLGFFQATVGRKLQFDEKQNWLTLTFVINEGPRYKIRNVSFIGNHKLANATLDKNLKLTAGQWFNQGAMSHDLNVVRDLYGGQGYVFADIQPDPRLLEGRPEMDLIYNIKEGSRYRVGLITVNIQGDGAHTHSRTIYDRLSLRPGDILDTRKLRSDERRLKASQIFAIDPLKAPKIVFSPLGAKDDPDGAIADGPGHRSRRFGGGSGGIGSADAGSYRGQCADGPDDRDVYVAMNVGGTLLPGADRRPDLDALPLDTMVAAPAARFSTERPIAPSLWQRIVGQVRRTAARLSGQPIVRGQRPDAPRGNPTLVYRGQSPNGGVPMQPTDPDSMSRETRYPPTSAAAPAAGYPPAAGYSPAGYAPPAAAPAYDYSGQPAPAAPYGNPPYAQAAQPGYPNSAGYSNRGGAIRRRPVNRICTGPTPFMAGRRSAAM